LRRHDMDLAELAVRYAREGGASYAEARLHRNYYVAYSLKSGEVEPAETADSYGLGIRVLVEGALAFTSVNLLTRATVRDAVAAAIRRARAASAILRRAVRFSPEKAHQRRWSAPEAKKLRNVDAEEAISLLKDVDRVIATYKAAAKIPQRLLRLAFGVEEKYFVNSEGARVEGRIPRLAYIHYLTALLDGQSAQRFRQEGYSGGWEVLRKIDPMHAAEEDAGILTRILESAQPAPTGTMDVLLGPEISGLASHEACGHPQEADRVLGREGAQAGESYLKPDSLGMRIGSEEANISDDPSIPNSYGFHLYDDEGVEAVKRHLIRSGCIQEYLHNRSTAAEFGLTSNSAARAVSYDREPIVRMANTFVEPGDHTLEELLEGVKVGVYMKSFMEWNIDDKRINQRYVGLEAYLVENGHIKHLVKAPVLEITTHRLWSSLDARGRELVFKAATCGKGDPMQPCPVWTGGPVIRLRNVRVGSR